MVCVCAAITLLCSTFATAESDIPVPASRSFHVTPAGTFIPLENGQWLFFEGVDVFTEFGLAVHDGVYSALFSMVATPVVMMTIGLLPSALSTGPVGAMLVLAWKFRTPLKGWWSYLQGARGLWNYQSWRIGRMPVYFSSDAITRKLLVSVRYPLGVEHQPQLEIVRLPDHEELSFHTQPLTPVEQAFDELAEAMGKERLARMVATVKSHNIVLSVQDAEGHWVHRDMVRPQQPLLLEQLYSWSGRTASTQLHSLLKPEVVSAFTKALYCRDRAKDAWQMISPKLAESTQASQYQLARSEGQCDLLEVSDGSTRLGGFAGFMHVNTNRNCEVAQEQLSLFDDGYYENALIANSRVKTIPYWLNRLVARTLAESVSLTTQLAFTPLWSIAAGSSKGGVESTAAQTDGGMLGLMERQSLRCISLSRPEAGSITPAESERICSWRLRPAQ
ncbi:hypothetical protein PAHA111176_11875 [Parendozoicomonas haliclonae]|uniref:Uncharacterized protein n=1 Tax=Parendozoicomonas haliclonae TaxID=1960125 RepID=A0A1X7AMB3_9GAMM|nr:hypothetical protein EHSB41UT_03209 [Parendozoicomonas haliclonae]